MNEEEAREYIEQFIGIKKEYKCKPIKVKTLNNTRVAIEAVLNLLEKKDKDIIEAKEANRQLSVELQKKDKLIKVMAKNYVCKRKCNLEDKKNKYANCIECVIDFYERKVENGN